ncbi:hypothetical protein [Agrobacterium tumefaciens]|uniref:hypothetical protein n=1 Tax=Agrobacterium tumefaciens TaxID=358 RepID=UPI001572CB78|nr:hypothetical protein [Agrobacterium tumefaciens]
MSETGEVIYTYSKCHRMEGERRWRDDDTGFSVFSSFDDAKTDLLELKGTIADDPDDIWSPMQIEKIEMLPMTRDNLLKLLNEGMEAVVHKSEVVEIVE